MSFAKTPKNATSLESVMRQSEWTEDQRKAFGRALRDFRNEKGWTPAMLAKFITQWLTEHKAGSGREKEGVSEGTVRRYESGKFAPGVRIRRAIAELLKMDIQKIIYPNERDWESGKSGNMPDDVIKNDQITNGRRLTKIYGDVISDFLQITGATKIENFHEFVGTYLVFRHSFNPDVINVVWLQIIQTSDELSIPHYRIFQRSSSETEIKGDGFVIGSERHLTCVGHRGDADLEMVIFNRIKPPVKFLVGVALTSTQDRYTIAANVFCERVSDGIALEREKYDNLIRPQSADELKRALLRIGKDERFFRRMLFFIDNQPRHGAKVLYGRAVQEKFEFENRFRK